MRYTQMQLPAADGTPLFVRRYSPWRGDAARTILLVHGASEHSGRYEHVAQSAVEAGWNVVAADHRGHGRSGGVHTHVRRFREYVRDLEHVYNHFGLSRESTALVAHSMGGLIAIRHAQTFPDRFAATVLMSPLLGLRVRISPATWVMGRLASYVVPATRFRSRIDLSETTRNVEVLLRRHNDRLIRRSVTAGWFFAMRRSLRSAWKHAGRITCPLLIMQGACDRIVDPTAPFHWLRRVGSSDRHIEMLPEHLHELFNEPDWRKTTTFTLNWLNDRLPAEQNHVIQLNRAL